jgi:hypothetical protein
MKNYNPESQTEKVSERFPSLVNLVQKTLRQRVVLWMRNNEKFKEKFNKVKITEDRLKYESFESYLNKMVPVS